MRAALNLPVGRYRLDFARERGAMGGRFLGSAWRGVLGHSLKRLVCVTRAPACETCLLYRSCVYPYVFETPPPVGAAKMRRYEAAPHPFSLAVPFDASGERYGLGLTLFGRANAHIAYLVHALRSAGEEGLWGGAGRFRLEAVRQEEPVGSGQWHTVHEPDGALEPMPVRAAMWPEQPWPEARVLLETPLRLRLRLRDQEQYVTPADFAPWAFLGSLLRRASMLTQFHTETPLETDFAGLMRTARAAQAEGADLRWHEWTRRSNRQDALLQMGGLLGEFRLSGETLAAFWPYVWLGQFMQAGKGTSLGLGQYRLERPDGAPA